MSSLAAAYGMKKAKKHGGTDCSMCGGGACRLSKGGVTVSRKPATPDPTDDSQTLFSTPKTMGPDVWRPAGGYGHDWARSNSGNGQSYSMDDYSEPSKKSASNYADGGMIDDDVVDNIMRERMSEGGQVANATPPEADEMPAEFDDLVLDDDLEGTNSGAADGDNLGDEQEDEDRLDVVKQVMRSRAKKDRNQRQA